MDQINLTREEEIKFMKWLEYQASVSKGIVEQMTKINLPEGVVKTEKVKCAAFSYVHEYLENRESVCVSAGT